MTHTNVAMDWRKEFGIDSRKPPIFFSSKADLSASIPQAHVIRRAFEILELDGVFCMEHSPLVYFKQVENITADKALHLHKKFWNHGGAPVLVLISKTQVHVYSGMSRPVPKEQAQANPPSLVQTLDRVSEGLRTFLTSVESGEFFQKNAKSFNPKHRVDSDLLDNLKGTRDVLDEITQRNIAPHVLDALLCRLVFTCYLFDREVIEQNYLQEIGIQNAGHLRDVLAIQPVKDAKTALYDLFQKLGQDFNGDLFSYDLEAEAKQITNKHIQTLNDFFHGTLVHSGQQSFWPYDFSIIPIETISAIYEHFLKAVDHSTGAFYTPRFLAEIVLDTALENFGSLLGKKFLDPSCGSGIFLVGLFNRMAEEWKQANPTARNDRRAKELMLLLQDSLFGTDINPTACRITAFSLYLAFLDQLTPRGIQELQAKGGALPYLVADPQCKRETSSGKNIICTDFFSSEADIPKDVDLVIGNPPWGSFAKDDTPAGQWCKKNRKPLPDKQIAVSFVWKGAEHISSGGSVCFVLPYGLLFNHSPTAIAFQKAWIKQHTIERVLNLSDFNRFLFKRAIHPALVISYKNEKPADMQQQIEYWVPKADWTVTQAEVITVSSEDRSAVSIKDILRDLDGEDAPQIWNQRFWATPRDLRLIDRLSLYPRLRDHVRGSRERNSKKPWVIAEGFQPVGKSDDPKKAKALILPSTNFIPAASNDLNLFLLPNDCEDLQSSSITVRNGSNRNTEVFKGPHVLIAKGFRQIAFADFDVSFRHALRGIHGPNEHRDFLVFLAAYLRSPLAKYFIFHTSSSWGPYRAEVHVQEILRLPIPFPDQQSDKKRCHEIIKQVAHLVDKAIQKSEKNFLNRENSIQEATNKIEPLIYEYFDIQPLERILIEDTLKITIPSIQPSQLKMPVPTVERSSLEQQNAYTTRVCDMLNMWGKNSPDIVRGQVFSSNSLGVGMVMLEKVRKSEANTPIKSEHSEDILRVIEHIRKLASSEHGTVNPIRGVMVFDKNRLYIVKPLGQRNWTQTAALNDADEIAGTLLMHSQKERA